MDNLLDGLKDKIEEIVKKIMSDKKFAKKFKETPAKAVEEVIGVDLPDEKIDAVIKMVKTKITVDNVKDLFSSDDSKKKKTTKKSSDSIDMGDVIDTVKSFIDKK